MYRVHQIDSLDLPELQPYRTMRRQFAHREQGIFVAEGEKVVRRLLESRFEVISALLPEKWLADLEPNLRERPETVEVFVAEKALLETLTGYSMYQGLLALGRIPPQPTLDEILRDAPRPWLFVATDGLCNAENLGSIIRNSAALGATLVATSDACSSPFLRRAVRSSMGTIFNLPVIEAVRLPDFIQNLRGRGIHSVAAHGHAAGPTISSANLAGDCCIVLGSEGQGLRRETLVNCDQAVAIPMSREVDSLNVSHAAAIFLYEAARQRGRV